jgi:UDP-GlcNAc:undecaprenyl-phosphate/decaprenyl-phosphate GlcNAc-1-phosphate transferase
VLRFIGPAGASFALCVFAILALRPLAIAIDLIDRPGGRKTHHGNVPIVGGLAMFLGMSLGVGLLPPSAGVDSAFLGACALLVTVGLVDDRFDLSPWARLPIQIAAAAVLVLGAGALVRNVGDPFGIGVLTMNEAGAQFFTIFLVIAAINAFNMLDGMDGLAGATALVALLGLAFLALTSGQAIVGGVALIIGGAVCAFLIFNLPSHKNRPLRCFMGDAGSTLLGFCVAWLCIQVSQGPVRSAAPVTTLWVVAMPLYELVWTTLRRVLRGTSPFRADTAHFHHLLLKAGFGVRGAFAVFIALGSMLAGVGLLAERIGVPERISFLLLILAGVGVVTLMYRAHVLYRIIPKSFHRSAAAVVNSVVPRQDRQVRK